MNLEKKIQKQLSECSKACLNLLDSIETLDESTPHLKRKKGDLQVAAKILIGEVYRVRLALADYFKEEYVPKVLPLGGPEATS